ncbi:Ras GTP-ase activating protein [Entamoeba marina]
MIRQTFFKKHSPRHSFEERQQHVEITSERADQFLRGCLAYNSYFFHLFVRTLPSDKAEFWDCIRDLLLSTGNITSFMEIEIENEVAKTELPGQLFRINNGVTAMVSSLMRKEASGIFVNFVKPLIAEISSYGKTLEINPKMVQQATAKQNMWRLFDIIDRQIEKLLQCKDYVSDTLKSILQIIRTKIVKKFGTHAALNSVGGFIFLRFINPALLTPNTFMKDLSPLSTEARRTVIYFTKVTQALSNQSTLPIPEDYMQPIQEYLPLLQPYVTDFLTSISTTNFQESPGYVPITDLSCAIKMIKILDNQKLMDLIREGAIVDGMQNIWSNVYAGITSIGDVEEWEYHEKATDALRHLAMVYVKRMDRMVEKIIDFDLRIDHILEHPIHQNYQQPSGSRPSLRRTSSESSETLDAHAGSINANKRGTREYPILDTLNICLIEPVPIPTHLSPVDAQLLETTIEMEQSIITKCNNCSNRRILSKCYHQLHYYFHWIITDLSLTESFSQNLETKFLVSFETAKTKFDNLFNMIRLGKVFLCSEVVQTTLLTGRLNHLVTLLGDIEKLFDY